LDEDTRSNLTHLLRDLGEYFTMDADRTPVSAIMTKAVCVDANLDLERLKSLILKRGFSGVPVVDAAGRAIGVVSKTDLVRDEFETLDASLATDDVVAATAPKLGGGANAALIAHGTVAEVMTPVAVTVPEQLSISKAAAIMAAREIHRLPVVSSDGTVVGIVSSLDIVRWLANQSAPQS
jgi:CBS domain-containing protein